MKYLLSLLWLWWLCAVFMLHGCTTVQVEPEATEVTTEDAKKAWKRRQQVLAHLQTWLLNGRASVTYRDENWPFSLQWKQESAQRYTLKIYHPLTRNRLGKLSKQENVVYFVGNKGKTYRDTSAEHLLQQQLNIKIPIDGMRYWVRGITAPQYAIDSFTLDHIGRPTSIQQAGWIVRYTDYENSSYKALPQRVDIIRTTPEVIKVKVRIKKWSG